MILPLKQHQRTWKRGYNTIYNPLKSFWGFPGGASGKGPTWLKQETEETWNQSLGREDPLEEGMATHSSILALRIPEWTEEPGRLESIGSHRV